MNTKKTHFESLLLVPYSADNYQLIYDKNRLLLEQILYRDFIVAFGDDQFGLQEQSQELVLTWSSEYSDGPSRTAKIIFSWDGNNFSFHQTLYSEAEYRFQAIQDADNAVNFAEYGKALTLYQDAIFNPKLRWYSQQLQNTFSAPWNKLTPIPDSYQDSTEYPKLASYAYYRIILLHAFHRFESDAGTVYNTLQQKFSADPNGRPYAEIATAFWDAYQSTHKMYDGCAAAIHYADEHPEILIPLGSDYHGSQSRIYMPADVCPFR